MACLSTHHVAKVGVTGKCSKPMWQGGWECFCDDPAYGEQYDEGTKHAPGWWSPRTRYGGYVNPYNAPPYVPSFCCKGHGGPGENDIRFVRDGNMWCAFMPGFENLQESVAGFGPTQPAAEADLAHRRERDSHE